MREFASWFSKRLIIGIVLMGIALAAWNWKHQGDSHAAIPNIRGTILDPHEEPQKPKAEPENCQSGAEGKLARPSDEGGLPPPSHPPVTANDGWPAGIRQLSREAQRKRLYIYLPPNISMEEAERW